MATRSLQRRSLLDAVFNLREIVKQMILLEDHLNHRHKFCADCIRKHLLTIEAFAEEAVTLDDPYGDIRSLASAIVEKAKLWMEAFCDEVDPPAIASEVRQVRKLLVPLCCDPRGAKNRVASLWWGQKFCSFA